LAIVQIKSKEKSMTEENKTPETTNAGESATTPQPVTTPAPANTTEAPKVAEVKPEEKKKEGYQGPPIRVFVYDGTEYPDPDPNMSVDEVRQGLLFAFPELSNADTSSRKDGEKTIYTFSKRVGTKG
jgi:PRTRC genetic system protein C